MQMLLFFLAKSYGDLIIFNMYNALGFVSDPIGDGVDFREFYNFQYMQCCQGPCLTSLSLVFSTVDA